MVMAKCLKEPAVKIQLSVQDKVVKGFWMDMLNTLFYFVMKGDILIHFRGKKIQCRQEILLCVLWYPCFAFANDKVDKEYKTQQKSVRTNQLKMYSCNKFICNSDQHLISLNMHTYFDMVKADQR